MRTMINRFRRDESGTTAVEYGLIAALVGVVIIIGATQLGISLNTVFKGLAIELENAQP